MKDSAHTVIFAVVLGVICSVLLAGVSQFTKPRRLANEKAEEVRNFLSALGAPVAEDATPATLLDVFEANIKTREQGDLTLYEYVPDGAQDVVAVAVPFSGPGLWGPIYGVLALESDLRTIRGIRFYKQEETPGLGGEIASDWFQAQFKGKSIVSSKAEPGFHVGRDGDAEEQNSVDGITGATMTSSKVEEMLDRLAKQVKGK